MQTKDALREREKMPFEDITKEMLRESRKCILAALIKYAKQACKITGTKHEGRPIMIIKSIRSTRVRVPKKIIPDSFIQEVFEANSTKKFHFEFCQKDPRYIHIILSEKPLIIEGQGILFYFFRELLQYLDAEKNNRRLKK